MSARVVSQRRVIWINGLLFQMLYLSQELFNRKGIHEKIVSITRP